MTTALSDGAVLWVFCATAVLPGTEAVVDNTAAVAEPGSVTTPDDVLDPSGLPYQFITPSSTWDQVCDPGSADDRRVTPRSVTTVTSGATDRVVVFYEHICTANGLAVGSGGIGVAEFVYDPAHPPSGPIQATVLDDVLWQGDAPASPPGSGAPDTETMGGFGQMTLYDPADGLVYVYRCDTDSEPVVGCQVGRVDPADLTDTNAYEWWDPGSLSWSAVVPDPGTATMPMAGRDGGVAVGAGRPASVSWYPDAGVWGMSYLEWGPTPPYGATAVVRSANHPNGPWSAPVRVTIPECVPTGPACTGMYGHPALSTRTSWAISFFSDPDAGGDGGTSVVHAGMFADSWTDVPRDDPDFADLDLLGVYGIVDRVHPTYTFRPDDTAERAEAAEMLWRVVGRPAVPPSAPTFTDVGPGHANAAAIEWLAASGADVTPAGGPWSPGAPLDRQVLAAWLWRDAGSPAVDAQAIFSDVPAGHPYFAPIMWAYQQGLIAEVTATTWDPTGDIARRDVGTAVMQFQDLMIRGTVTDADSGAPVAGVMVRVHDAAGAPFRTTTTGIDGKYHVSWLPAGSGYSVRFSDVEYADEWFDDKPASTTSPADADPVNIAVDQDRAAAEVDATLTAAKVALTRPAANSPVFATGSLVAEVSGVDNLDHVEFTVDGTIVDSDADGSDGWSITWDTTAVADGSHSVAAVAVDADGGQVVSPVHDVDVANSLSPAARVQADYDAARIDINTFLPLFLRANVERAQLLPERYQGPPSAATGDVTSTVFKKLASGWDSLSSATQDQLESMLTPTLQTGPPDPDFVVEYGLPPDPGDESVYPGCDTNVVEWGRIFAIHGIWWVQTIEYSPSTCAATGFTCDGTATEVPDLKFRFSVNGTPWAFPDEPTNAIPGTVVPQNMVDMANQFFNAFEAYDEMGFELGGNLDDGKPLNVTLIPKGFGINPFSVPICWSCHGIPNFGDFGVAITPDQIGSVPRHEAFHIMQLAHLSTYDVVSELLPGDLGRDTTLWWMEATAVWADHQAVEAMQADGESPPEATEYTLSFPAFAAEPGHELTKYLFLGDSQSQYGAFILAEYLQDRFDQPGFPSFVLRTFQELGESDGRSAIEAIEDVLEENGSSFKDAIPRFWASAYLLADVNMIGVGFDDPDVADWRGALGTSGTGNDSFSQLARPGRVDNSPVVVPHSGSTGPISFGVNPGGAGIIDFSMEPGWEGTVTADITVDPGSRYDKYVAVMVAYDSSGYPNVCDRDGYTVIEFQDLALATGTHVDLDEDCPTASLLIVNHDANSSKGPPDSISVTLSMVDPVPMDPPTAQTATIDGPGVTGVAPGGLIGIVSDPPAAGPAGDPGALCVAVDVHAGAGAPLFGFVSPVIRLVDPFDQTVLSELSGLDTLMDAYTTKTFNLGPYVHDPWTALAVTVQEDQGDVLSWDAYPTSC